MTEFIKAYSQIGIPIKSMLNPDCISSVEETQLISGHGFHKAWIGDKEFFISSEDVEKSLGIKDAYLEAKDILGHGISFVRSVETDPLHDKEECLNGVCYVIEEKDDCLEFFMKHGIFLFHHSAPSFKGIIDWLTSEVVFCMKGEYL